jgi:hypothetical protein
MKNNVKLCNFTTAVNPNLKLPALKLKYSNLSNDRKIKWMTVFVWIEVDLLMQDGINCICSHTRPIDLLLIYC